MNKNRFYQFVIAGLLMSNLILLTFMFMGKKKRGHHQVPKKIIIERLGFSQEQQAQYEELIHSHRLSVRKNADQITSIKNTLYATLADEQKDSILIDSLQNKLSQTKGNIEQLHYEHFMAIKELCATEQLSKFKSLSKDLAKFFSPKGVHRRGRRK